LHLGGIPLKKAFTVITFITLLTSVLFLVFGCTTKQSPAIQADKTSLSKPVIYTSIYPIYDFVNKIGGDKVIIKNILPAGAEPHSYEPSARLLAELSKAQLFIYNGVGMEPYLDKFRKTLQGSPLIMVEAGRGIDLIKVNDEGSNVHDDPHVWLSPSSALIMGQNILQAIISIDPKNKSYYENNYKTFKDNLTSLDQEYKDTLTRCKKKDVVVTHAAFGYLCREYGLNQISVMGLNAEAEPTPRKIKEIIESIKKQHITHIFFETLYSPKVSDTISRETGTQILQLYPLDTLTENQIGKGEDYFSIMRLNLKNLKDALEYKP
jgi:zinc transport system substrate-binding protein